MQQSGCEICGQMAVIPAGNFVIGSPKGEPGRHYDENSPPQPIRVSTFEIGRSEVTQAQWRAVMGTSPSHNTGCDTCPVEAVSWHDISGPDGFLARLNKLTGRNYRLPTEEEWEYATRANSTSAFWWGSLFDARRANNNGSKPLPPSQSFVNPFGLAHTSGNVYEWVLDCYAESFAQLAGNHRTPEVDAICSHRVVRGGSAWDFPKYLRSANRLRHPPDYSYKFLGFRLARSQ